MHGSARALISVAAIVAGCRTSAPLPMSASAPPPAIAEPETPSEPAGAWDPGCRTDDPPTLRDCVRPEHYQTLLHAVTGRRPPGSRHWQRVQNLCDETLASLGFSVERHDYGTGINVVGVRRGKRWPDQQVVVGAHYDHIAGCDGADDNASGVAGILEMARVLSGTEFARTLVVACWDEEERGLIGSRAWAERAREREEEIAVYFNFDAIAFTDPRPGAQEVPGGFGLLFPGAVAALEERENRADFITVITDQSALPHAKDLVAAAEADGLPVSLLDIPTLVQRSHVAVDLQRSDHASLWNQGYPAIMITDTAEFRSDAYHCRGRPDTVASLDLPFAIRVVRATTQATAIALTGPTEPTDPA